MEWFQNVNDFDREGVGKRVYITFYGTFKVFGMGKLVAKFL